jgi:hypothetical protein
MTSLPTTDPTPRSGASRRAPSSAPERHVAALALALALATLVPVHAQPFEPSVTALPFAEPFASPAALEAWERGVGAFSGEGPASEVAWDDGALRLRGDAATERWLTVHRHFDSGDADWVLVEARMRWTGLDGAAARFRNANLFLRTDQGLTPLPIADGDSDWVTVRRRLPVGAPHAVFIVAAFLSMPGALWVDDIAITPSVAPEWRVLETVHYRYHVLPDLTVDDAAQRFNEAAYAELSSTLGVTRTEPIDYYYYGDRARMEELTGFQGNARREGSAIHSIFATDRHETVHVLADAWGDPPALLAEGLAVYLSGGWGGRPLPEVAHELVAAGTWPPLREVFASRGFRARSDAITYPASGAFVAWLAQRFGMDTLRSAYGALDNAASDADNDAALRATFGAGIDELEARFLEDLVSGAFPVE